MDRIALSGRFGSEAYKALEVALEPEQVSLGPMILPRVGTFQGDVTEVNIFVTNRVLALRLLEPVRKTLGFEYVSF